MWQKLKTYLSFVYTSKSKYKIHSPYLYDLVAHVLELKEQDSNLLQINEYRNQLSQQQEKLVFEGFGADSSRKEHSIKYIEKHISTPHKIGNWYYRIIQRYAYKNIVELGTCIGIGTLYLASNKNTQITSFEGNKASVHQAKQIFQKFNLENIHLIEGPIENTLAKFIEDTAVIDLVIMDANHTYEATISYFETILPKLHENSMVIVDDIYWSNEMMKAWNTIRNHSKVTLSLDFYRCGFLLFAPNRVEKEHFKVWVND